MKKITLLLFMVFISITSFAQVELISIIGEGVNVQTPNSAQQDPCSKEETTALVENGFGNLSVNEVSDNFTVADGEVFAVSSAIVRVILTPGSPLADVTIRFYEGDGEFPGALVSESTIVPTSQDVIESISGFDVRELVLDFDSVELSGIDGEETTFWVSIFTPNSVAASNFLQTTTDTDDTILVSFRNGSDPSAAWDNEFVNAQGVLTQLEPAAYFILSGECDLLNVNETALSQISLYPNPATSLVSLNLPSGVEVKSAVLYDVLGKNTGVTISNGSMNVSSLSRGVYILSLETTAGTLTKKVVKK